MSNLTVKTNHVPRPVIYWYELTETEQKEFDYLDSDEKRDSASFFRYKGYVYDLGEFSYIDHCLHMPQCFSDLKNWQGYLSDSYFSGIVIKYCQDYEYVIAGTYFS